MFGGDRAGCRREDVNVRKMRQLVLIQQLAGNWLRLRSPASIAKPELNLVLATIYG